MKEKIVRQEGKEFAIVDANGVLKRGTFDECRELMREARALSLTVDELLEYQADEATLEGERYAEFGMSWVCGGGSPSDVSLAWAQFGRDR